MDSTSILVLLSAAVGAVAWLYSTFQTKIEAAKIDLRFDRLETKIDQLIKDE